MIHSDKTWDEVRSGYRVIDEIGRGSTGFVYRSIRLSDGKEVAVKVSKSLRRVEGEALLKVFETLGCAPEPYESGTDYLAMEFVDAVTLRVKVKQTQSVEEMIKLLEQYVDICERVSKVGVVHGDPHWANVLVRKDGSFVVVDFGNANQLVEEITMAKLFVASLSHLSVIESDLYRELTEEFEFVKHRTPRTTGDLRESIKYLQMKIQPKVS